MIYNFIEHNGNKYIVVGQTIAHDRTAEQVQVEYDVDLALPMTNRRFPPPSTGFNLCNLIPDVIFIDSGSDTPVTSSINI